ncbi:MAG: hypothetical protein HY694_02405 [Deltaproteobacteria bacterium]|nr:hypothetical protein [Deltaproteobacteria bacterium]
MAEITWTAEAQRWIEDIFEYIIAYLIKDDGNIDVLGVFHGSLDISKYQL